MTNEIHGGTEKAAKARRKHAPVSQPELKCEPVLIRAGHSGEWTPAEELRAAALAASIQGMDVTLDCAGIDHLDASALQILLALDSELRNRGRKLQLAKPSEQLRKWLGFAGADERFLMNERKSDE